MPRKFVLGSDQAPAAWSRALRGSCVGERRTAIVPWKSGYGAAGEAALGIPPRADLKLIFEVVEVGSRPVPGFEQLAGEARKDADASLADSLEEDGDADGSSDASSENGLSTSDEL